MDENRLNEIVAALNQKKVFQPCPRCAAKNFSVVGESEISLTPPPSTSARDLLSARSSITTMPTIIITCDNCGFIAQHARAALEISPWTRIFKSLGDLK